MRTSVTRTLLLAGLLASLVGTATAPAAHAIRNPRDGGRVELVDRAARTESWLARFVSAVRLALPGGVIRKDGAVPIGTGKT